MPVCVTQQEIITSQHRGSGAVHGQTVTHWQFICDGLGVHSEAEKKEPIFFGAHLLNA